MRQREEMKPAFVISLDFELFWGVADSRSITDYRDYIEGEWSAIPRMLALFRRYDVRATWATVGMVICRDYSQWREIRPAMMPGYYRRECSTYSLDALARDYPRLFFARPLVEEILATPGQELGTHSYSHFYCGEAGATPEQFAADLICAKQMLGELGAQCRSLVFPRNQVKKEFVAELEQAGIMAYRGNPNHWLYRDGHRTPGGMAGRALRFSDSWLPLTGAHTTRPKLENGVVNVPASLFLRPWSRRLDSLESLRLTRLKQAMTRAARSGGVCHLWWHPHNFGINTEQNLKALESLLQHFQGLRDSYGMHSLSMGDIASAMNTEAGASEYTN